MIQEESLEETGVPRNRPDVSIDTVGLICPYPALETQKALRRLEKGQILEVITNNEPTAEKSIPFLCEQSGSNFRVRREGDRWRILIWK